MGFRASNTSNVPVLVAQEVAVDDAEKTVTIGFGDTAYGIYAPFEGVFAMRFDVDFKSPDDYTVRVGNIYGFAADLYDGGAKVTAGTLGSGGLYMLSFDTSTRKLSMAGGHGGHCGFSLEWGEF